MRHIALVILMGTASMASAQPARIQPVPTWWEKIIPLGDLIQQWCEDQGAEYAQDDNHQLGPGPQWKCYLEIPEPDRG